MGPERFSRVSCAFSVIRMVFYTTVILVSILLASGIIIYISIILVIHLEIELKTNLQ